MVERVDSASTWRRVQISRFGVIPKSQPGKWRLILDLSHPDGKSVNDGIDQEICSLTYSSVDQAAQCIVALGRGGTVSKAGPGQECVPDDSYSPGRQTPSGDEVEE